MTPHICHTEDGVDIPCVCVHGVDHDEDQFDQPRDDADA